MNSTLTLPIHRSQVTTPKVRRSVWKRLAWFSIATAGLAIAAIQKDRLHGMLSAKPTTTEKPMVPTERSVNVVQPVVQNNPTELLLPAQLLPYEQTFLYARIDGYLAKWHVDRGTRVKTGDLLAEIDAPELDQQTEQALANLEQGKATLVQLKADLDQARADLENSLAQVKLAEANRDYANRELERTSQLVRSGAVGRSEHEGNIRNRDVALAQLTAAKADVNAKQKTIASRTAALGTQEATIKGLEANYHRLQELQKFKRIVAPFDGSITRRHAETGTLVQANNGQPLFHIQNSLQIRVQVDVPQSFAQQARQTKKALVIVPELPNTPLTATIGRTANALDPNTRTLRVELDLPNPERKVLAGMYAQVQLTTPKAQPTILVPSNVLRYTPAGVEVAVVDKNQLTLRKVKLGRDYGKGVEVITGLDGKEQLVVNPADDLQSGEAVQVAGKQTLDSKSFAMGH